MKKTRKTILISVAVIIGLVAANVVYWITSDIQQECYQKIRSGKELNLYEKSSIYTINLCICAFGWSLSPEATVQQILCTVPSKDGLTIPSRFFSRHEKIQGLMKKYPNATAAKPALIAWSPQYNEFGLWSAYTSGNCRIGLALNGMYLYQEDGQWVISYIQEFAFPYLSEPTNIGPFKFHESLIRYLQDIGWLYKPNFKWMLEVEE